MVTGWIQSLTGRERGLLMLGLALALVSLAWVLVIEPLRARQEAARTAWAGVTAEAAWLEDRAAALAGLQADRPRRGAPAGPLPRDVAALEAALNASAHGRRLTRIAPQGGGRVELVLDGVSYLGLMTWLRDTGLDAAIATLTLRGTDTSDLVAATLLVDLTPPEPAE